MIGIGAIRAMYSPLLVVVREVRVGQDSERFAVAGPGEADAELEPLSHDLAVYRQWPWRDKARRAPSGESPSQSLPKQAIGAERRPPIWPPMLPK